MFPLSEEQAKQLALEFKAKRAEAAKKGACPKCGSMTKGNGMPEVPYAMKIHTPDGEKGDDWFNCHNCGNKYRFTKQ